MINLPQKEVPSQLNEREMRNIYIHNQLNPHNDSGGDICMPFNKSNKTENQQNHSSFREKAISLKTDKFAKRPPSLNKINKQLP
jgi:hypothetical protein